MSTAPFVDVLTVTEEGEIPSIMIDPCLDAFRVGRTRTLNEMLLPGYSTGNDCTTSELIPAAALIQQVVRITDSTLPTVELLTFFIDGGFINPQTCVVSEDGVAAAQATQWEANFSLFAAGMRHSGMAFVNRVDGLFVNPNVFFVDDDGIADALNADDVVGNAFYIPAPVAKGALLSCSASTSKQSTKLRVALPDGFHLLEGWLKSGGRDQALRTDKWS